MVTVTTYARLVEILTSGGGERPDPPSYFPDVGLTHETWHLAGKVYELQAYGKNQTGAWTLTAGVPKPQQTVEYPKVQDGPGWYKVARCDMDEGQIRKALGISE